MPDVETIVEKDTKTVQNLKNLKNIKLSLLTIILHPWNLSLKH